MWDNFFDHSVKLTAPNNIPFKSISSSTKKKTCNKQMEFERKVSFESDTDFQTFLLPLEQDFTKSSKGYASLLTSISDKEVKSVDCKNESEKSKPNLSNDLSETDSLKNSTSSKLFHKYPLCSNNHECTGNQNNLYYQKCTLLIHDTLENIDESDDSSESSEIDNFYNGCINSQNFVDDSSSDDSVIFSEEVKNNKLCSNAEIKQTFVTSIDSGGSDDDCQEESQENTSTFFSEDFAFECDSVDLLENSVALERSIYGSILTFRSEGYVNESFEYDILTEKSNFLKSVNKSWDDAMKNISGEPHESKRVSFVPLPNLVSVLQYEPDEDDYCYSLYVLDQLRFRNRIEEFEHIITPYLTPEHRARIYQRNYLQD